MKIKRQKEGLHREFYPNGELREEYFIKNGERHGKQKCWHDNGQLESETNFVHGEMTGRMRLWFSDGMFLTDKYFLNWRPISKKKYQELCKGNLDLPIYSDEKPTNTLGNYVRRLKRERRQQAKLGPTAEQIEEQRYFDVQCTSEVRKRNSKDLVTWLKRKASGDTELGEMSKAEALRLAKKVYALGASKIWVTGIEKDPDDSQYSKQLIVSLPKDKPRRQKIAALCADPARGVIGGGGTLAIRTGQKFMSVSLL